jgi:hypothetical protein
MFKAYKEPRKPAYDWTDMLVEKGIPLLGTAGGAIAGGLIAGPAGIAPGMAIGSGLGNTISGLASEKPTSEAKMAKGIQGGMKGYEDWRQLSPEKKLDTNESGKIPGVTPAAAPVKIPSVAPTATNDFGQMTGALTDTSSNLVGKEEPLYKSTYAPRFARF